VGNRFPNLPALSLFGILRVTVLLLFRTLVKTQSMLIFQFLSLILFFCIGHPVVFIKLKDNKMVSGFNQTQQYIILLYFVDVMFQSRDQQQKILAKRRIEYIQCK
jgi:hypothetical protein